MKTISRLTILVVVLLASGSKTNSCLLSSARTEQKTQAVITTKPVEINSWSLSTRFYF